MLSPADFLLYSVAQESIFIVNLARQLKRLPTPRFDPGRQNNFT